MVFFLNICDNYDDVRGVVSAHNDTGSINLYAPLEVSDVPYCDRVGEENDMDVDDKHVDKSYGMSSLGTQVNVEYTTPKSQVGQTSQAASINPSLSQQCVSNEDTPSNQNTGSNMFNVHLNYDPNIALTLILGTATFMQYSFMVPWSIWLQIHLTSKNPYLECANTF